MKPTAERRSCRSQARWTGVCPEGAHVRRRTGWSMKPLSSKKTIGLPRSAAPFLSAANPAFASGPWPRRPLLGPAARASGMSSPGRGAFSLRGPGDTPRETSWQRLRPPADRSKDRSDSRPLAVQPREFRPVAASASHSGGACGRDVAWLLRPPCLLSPQPDATALPKTLKHQGFPLLRRHPCPPATTAPRAAGELPIPLHFLSVSYLKIRMFTTPCSLAMQESIDRCNTVCCHTSVVAGVAVARRNTSTGYTPGSVIPGGNNVA